MTSKRGGGGRRDWPLPEAHFFEKKQLPVIVSRSSFCQKCFSDTGLRIRGRKFWSAVPLQATAAAVSVAVLQDLLNLVSQGYTFTSTLKV